MIINTLLGLFSNVKTTPGTMLSTYIIDIHHRTLPHKGPPPGIQTPTRHF